MLSKSPPARPAVSTRSRRLVGMLAGAAIGLFAVTPAFAVTPGGTVTVDANGCDFTVNIALDVPSPVIAWDVKVYAGSWWDGQTVLQGSVKDDADGKVVAGPYTLPAGHYNVAVDDEPVDHSAIVEDFTLSCPAASPSGSELPAQSESASPAGSESASPAGSESAAPIDSTATPSATGEELGAVGVGSVTPPPTDTASAPSSSGGTPGGWLTFAAIALAGSIVFAWANRRLGRVRGTSDVGSRRH